MKNTANQLDEAVNAARNQGARALILDLRYDPGGTLRAAEEVSDRFLPPERIIVSTRGNSVRSYVAKTEYPDTCQAWPVVVLTSDKSASASEIVAGALQDHKRAGIVGERTFGKGYVQRPYRLPGWGGEQVSIKVTTAYWYLPKGRNVQRSDDVDFWGVEPDFNVTLTPHEYRSLQKRWYNAGLIITPNDSPQDDDAEPEPADDELSSDKTLPDSASDQETTDQTTETEASSDDDDSEAEELPLAPDPQMQTAILIARLELLAKQK